MKVSNVPNKQSQISKIALWGPPGSGKTWLIHAFGKTLLKYSMQDPNFSYELTIENGTPFDSFSMPEDVAPTQTIEEQVFRFRRIGKKDSYSHRISSHTHEISIIDNKGINLVQLKDSVTTESLIDSQYIILLLDPSRSLLSNGISPYEMQSFDQPTEDYTYMVQELLNFLTQSSKLEHNVAVCVTKSDLISIKEREPESIIRIIFGSEMSKLFDIQGKKSLISFEFFNVSAAGYFRDSDGINKPNFDFLTGHLAKPNRWEPFNVESPFFWFFEAIERTRIMQSSDTSIMKFFLKSRMENYIPYPRRRF